MSKKSIKIISTIITAVLVIMLASSTTLFALNTPKDVETNKSVNGLNKVEDAGEGIIGAIRTVGMLVSVGILMVLGIKYMMGSAEEKASYKKTMMPYLVGAVLIFGASAVAQAVFDFISGF